MSDSKVINKAIKKAEDKFGSNIITTKKIEDVESVSTGSRKIDDILGVGGFPKSRITDLFGNEGSGKCLIKDSLINTESGLLTIEEVFNKNDVPITPDTETHSQKYTLMNKNGNKEDTSKFTQNGRKPVFKIKTKTGQSIKATSNHPIRVMSSSGFLEWKRLKKLNKGDWVALKRGNHTSTESFHDKSYLLGLLLADANLTSKKIILIKNDNPDILESIKEYGSKYLTKDYKVHKHSNSTEIHFNSKEDISKFRKETNLKCSIFENKEVPLYIREDITKWKSFIQGFMDCESHINDGKDAISVSFGSFKLLQQLQIMLQKFGILSTLEQEKVNNYPNNNHWKLSINGKSSDIYFNKIGFKSTKKMNKHKNFINKEHNTNNDTIPNQYPLLKSLYYNLEKNKELYKTFDLNRMKNKINLTYSELDKILSYYKDAPLFNHFKDIYDKKHIYTQIESIEYIGNKPTYDFKMPKTHSFIANGITVHNSTLTFQSIAEVLSNEGTAVFIDAEQAYTPDYGEQLGIDVENDNFVLVRPDYGEQALSIVEHFLTEADTDIIVVDSVPALVPKEELEGDLEDRTIALQARMMSKALRRFKSKVRETETALIFINQIRSTMNSGWGASEKATGGKALKFYSDVRLQVKRGATIKKQNNIIGHELKTQAVKNKVAPPFKETSVHLIYGKGIDNTYDIVERAIEEDIIIKNSSWFYFENEDNQIGQGINSVIKFMNKNNNKEKILKKLNNKKG